MTAIADDMHEDPSTAPSGTCRHCHLPVAYLLGIWTGPDGDISCYSREGMPDDHEPKGEQ